jgi:hypothetical protein
MLIAGAVTGIMSIIKKFEFLYTLELLLIVLILFYIVGILAKKIIDKSLQGKTKDDEIDLEIENDNLTKEQDLSENE